MDLKHYIILIILATTFGSCKKDLPARIDLTGVAKIQSILVPNEPPKVLPDQKIELNDLSTGSKFNLLTDKLGVFSFPGLEGSEQYKLSYRQEFTDANQYRAVYTGEQTFTGSSADLNSYTFMANLDTKNMKGVLLKVTDKGSGAISGAKVIFYSSEELAKLDSDLVGYGSICTLTSNNIGLSLAMQLPQKVYIKAMFKSEDGKVKLVSELQTVTVDTFKEISIVIK
ncbi:hypothetical protein QWY86_05490 [Pedobacter aquatilis]|uniref:hypothetical protein n=1 Tax=Pedobacter aquatilis TaxID=351343 RepID=UPI0025B4FA3F|nr:hypothetical protein [Pedobacter aquatilis]MDN3586110.1 hypothetical protein [Pedobacter aquatilis]